MDDPESGIICDQVAVSPLGHVWGINSDQCVYYRLNTYADKDTEGTGN